MTTRTSGDSLDVAKVDFTLPDAANAAQNVLSETVGFCARQLHVEGPGAALAMLRRDDRSAWGYFAYGLTRHLAAHLGALDDGVQAAYLVEDEATAEDSAFAEVGISPIHILVRADRKTQALSVLLSSLERELAKHAGRLLERPELAHLTDVQVIDSDESEAGTGYARMLNWLHNRPLQVWKR